MTFRSVARARWSRLSFLAFALCRIGFGQTAALSLSSGTGSAGGTVTLNLSLNATVTQPAALQWTLNYAPTDFSAVTVTAGSSASAAGKSVSCSASAGTQTCVLFGMNSTPIANGVVATVAMTVAPTSSTSSAIQLTNGAASSSAGLTIPTTATGATVAIVPSTGLSISGSINGVGSATLTLSGTVNATTTANAAGAYSFTGLANGSYTVTPSRSGFIFSPSSTTVTINGASQIVNFNATSSGSQTFSISGTISGGGGAALTLSGAANATTTANAAGAYSFTGLANGSYAVTPSRSGFTFSPSSTTVTISGASQIVNFNAASSGSQTFSISGTISGAGSATVVLSGTVNASTTANASGAYSFTGLANGSYTVTPSRSGFTFSPSSTTVTINGASQIVNFNAASSGSQTFSISGTISGAGSATVILSGTASASTTANASGAYSFTGLANGSYTVTPGRSGFSFSPSSTTVTINGASQTVNFSAVSTPSGQTFTISGSISGLGGATISLSGASSTTTTATTAGTFSFTGLSNGSYTVTPSRSGYTFSPASVPVTLNGSNQTANFNAIAGSTPTFSISGTISGGSGATVTLSGTSNSSTTANAAGAYSFAGLTNGSYTVTPTHSGFTFSPSSTTLTISGSNQTVNFTSSSSAGGTFTISGSISGAGNATIALSGSASATTTATAAGLYSFSGLANGSYIVTPSRSGYTFSPASIPVTINGANQTANFNAVAGSSGQTFTISGSISGLGGATITLSGASNSSTTANAGGAFSFTGLSNGAYIVTPSRSGYTFSPASIPVTISGANQTANFNAMAGSSGQTFTISGTISGTGLATVTLTGTANVTTTANAAGAYSFSGLANGPYTITPTRAGFTFSPSSTTLTISGANQTANFTAATGVTFSISGSVSVAAGGSGAVLTLSGKSSATTTANAAGAYVFSGLVNGTYTVTPSRAARAFSPTSQTVTINGANITNINFTSGTGTSNISKNASRGTADSTATPRHERNPLESPIGSGITVTGMTCTPNAVIPPATSTCQVSISSEAAASGATLSLSGDSNAFAPASLVMAPGATVSSFTAETTAVTSKTTVQMTATLGASSVSSPLTLLAPPASNGLSVDVTASQDSASASSAVTSPAFSTASGNELLVALVSAASPMPVSVNRVEGGGLNWTRTVRTNAQGGTSEVWRAFSSATLSDVSVTATLSGTVYSSLTVISFEGADPGADGTGAIGAVASANALSGAPAAALSTTMDGSWVLGVGNAVGSASSRVAGTGQHIVHQFQPPSAGMSWVQRAINATAAAGTAVSVDDTAPASDRFNLSAVEILPRSACMVGLAPQQRSVSIGGGSSTVAVANGFGCHWKATTDAPSWITLNGDSGTGNSSFTLTAAANAGKTRIGTVRAGNQSFKVLQAGSTQVFADVPPTAPSFDYVNLMYSGGISTGCGTSPLNYCPSQAVTRGQMAALVVSALDHLDRAAGALPHYTTTPYFQDVPASDPSFPFVQRLADLGLTSGCDTAPARYCPSASITHGEMAKVLIGGWMHSNSLSTFTSSPNPYFTDVTTEDSFFPYVQKMRDMGFWSGCSAREYCQSRPVLQSEMSALVMRSLVGAP